MNSENKDAPKKSGKKFAIFLFAIAGFSFLGQFLGFASGYFKYKTWPHAVAKYTGRTPIYSGGGKNNFPSCNHNFEFEFQGVPKTTSIMGDCKLFLGAMQVNDRVEIAYESKNGNPIISKNLLFGLDISRLIAILIIPFLTGFGFFVWKKG